MLARRILCRRPVLQAARSPALRPRAAPLQRRSLVSAPKPGDGPLMERRSDRELPDVEANRFRWSRTMPIFLALVTISSIAIFNYQKMSSPVVSSTLYALRTNPQAREYLGDEIYFNQQIPWISGEMNQLQGRINISFAVKGTKNVGVMRFASFRPTAKGMFETTEWSLETSDGHKIDLLDEGDPFKAIQFEGGLDEDEEDDLATRGFRQQMPKQR